MGANAQTIVPTFTASQVLTADQMNQSARTGVPVFATTTTRDAAFGGTGEKTLAEGQVCFIEAAPKRLQIYNGTAWIDFDIVYTDVSSTQAFTGFTKGNATVTSKYARLGKFVHFYGEVVLGTTSSMTGALDITLPFTAAAGIRFNTSAVSFNDASVGLFWGTGFHINTGALRLAAHNSAGTYATSADITSTLPFTWTSTDAFYWNHIYEAA